MQRLEDHLNYTSTVLGHSAPPAGYRWKSHDEHRTQVNRGPCTAHNQLAGGQCGNCLWHPNMLVKLPN